MNKILHSKKYDIPYCEMLKKDVPIWVYYKTSSKAKKKGWIKAVVVEAHEPRVLARRSKRGPPLRVAYEDVGIAPASPLTEELMS